MSPLPRIIDQAIMRQRLHYWLDEHRRVPLRLVIAPTGFGKTTGLVSYVEKHQNSYHFISFRHKTNEQALLSLLGEAFNWSGSTYKELLRALNTEDACQIFFDGVERLDSDANTLMERLICELPEKHSIVAVGTRLRCDINRYILQGIAVSLMSNTLLFTHEEITTLAGEKFSPEQLEDLRERTDGWPIVVSDVLRLAQENQLDPIEAYEHWLNLRGEIFLRSIQDDLQQSLPTTRDRLIAITVSQGDQFNHADILLNDGAPILNEQGSLRVLRVFADVQPVQEQPAKNNTEPLLVRMFGRFSIRLGNHEIQWIRRRDQQIIRYLLLCKGGSSSREDVVRVFWPETESQLAFQSLRTACSTIRKALIASFGIEKAEEFFQVTSSTMRVNVGTVVLDILRFTLHIKSAELAEAKRDWATQLAHVAAAENLYRDELFAGDPPQGWFANQRTTYQSMHEYASSKRTRLRVHCKVEATTE